VWDTARVAMSDVMFKRDADLAEVRGVVGHEMGHYVRGHVVVFGLAYGLLALVFFFVVDRLFPWTARVLGAEGVTGLADPAGLPEIGVVLAVLFLIATPLTSSVSRIAES